MRSERQYLQGIVSRKKTVATDLSTQIVDPTLPDQLSTWSFHYLWNWLESVSFAKISIRTIVRSRPRWELTSKTMIKSHITRNSFANRAYDSNEDNPSNWSKKKILIQASSNTSLGSLMKNHNMSIFPSPPSLSLSPFFSIYRIAKKLRVGSLFCAIDFIYIFMCRFVMFKCWWSIVSVIRYIDILDGLSGDTFFLLFMLTTLSAEWLDYFLGSVHRYGQEFRPDLAFACQLKWRKAKCNRLSPCKQCARRK